MTLAISAISVSGMISIILTATAVAEKIFDLMDEPTLINSGAL